MTQGTLYVHRPVLNAWAIIDWAKDQGLRTTLDPEDMHVTVVYSETPFAWPIPKTDSLLIRSKLKSESRDVRVLGGDAVCLCFDCPDLQERFDEMVAAGAVSKWGSYEAYITLTYDPGNVSAEDIEPYGGRIDLGPEVYGEIDSGFADEIVEKTLQKMRDDAPVVSDDVRALVEQYAGLSSAEKSVAKPARKAISRPAPVPDGKVLKSFLLYGDFAKTDMEKGQAFGFFSVAKVGDTIVTDGEGDQIPPSELEDAAYDHVIESRIADDNHDGSNRGTLIESMVFTPEKCAAIVKALADQGIKAVVDIPVHAWWAGHLITDLEVRKKVKSGEYAGYSIGGKAVRTANAA